MRAAAALPGLGYRVGLGLRPNGRYQDWRLRWEPNLTHNMAASAPCPTWKQPVLLGLRDAAIGVHNVCSWDTNKIGGLQDCTRPLTLVFPICSGCGSSLAHLVQVYCPLEGSRFHRVLNVFACCSRTCWGNMQSWKVLRSQYLDTRVEEQQNSKALQKPKESIAAKDWCEEADDWGMDEAVESQGDTICHLPENTQSVSPLSIETECTVWLQGLSLADPGQGLLLAKPLAMFQAYHVSVVDEEDFTGYIDVDHAQKLLKEYQKREGVDVEELMSESFASKGEQEKYEKSETKTKNQVFHQFMKRISVCQEQILRYSWNSQPLFITSPPPSFPDLVPKCGACGSGRVFEFQLMPALVTMLSSLEKDVSVEFGTVLVYSCEKSCWPSNQHSPLEEFAFVQEDPDQSFFK